MNVAKKQRIGQAAALALICALGLALMQQNNLYDTYRLAAAPASRGNVYVFFRQDRLPWADAFPNHTIYKYDPASKSWREYTGR